MKSIRDYFGRLLWRLSYSFHSWLYDRTGYGRRSGAKKTDIFKAAIPKRMLGKLETRAGLLRRDGGKAKPRERDAAGDGSKAKPRTIRSER
jgi:hypothetical protein